jgi:hypothetical protein
MHLDCPFKGYLIRRRALSLLDHGSRFCDAAIITRNSPLFKGGFFLPARVD